MIRASITSGPVQPQCFLSMKDPIPSMSAAGSERVNVTQRKFRSFRAVNSLSSTITMSGKPRIGSPVSKDRQNEAMSSGPVLVRRSLDGQDAGQHDARIVETAQASASRRAARSARSRRAGPAAAITTFDPWFNPCPE